MTPPRQQALLSFCRASHLLPLMLPMSVPAKQGFGKSSRTQSQLKDMGECLGECLKDMGECPAVQARQQSLGFQGQNSSFCRH